MDPARIISIIVVGKRSPIFRIVRRDYTVIASMTEEDASALYPQLVDFCYACMVCREGPRDHLVDRSPGYSWAFEGFKDPKTLSWTVHFSAAQGDTFTPWFILDEEETTALMFALKKQFGHYQPKLRAYPAPEERR